MIDPDKLKSSGTRDYLWEYLHAIRGYIEDIEEPLDQAGDRNLHQEERVDGREEAAESLTSLLDDFASLAKWCNEKLSTVA